MARKVPQNKPAENLLIKGQTRIAGYIVNLGQPFKTAAAELGTTPRTLKNFLFQPRAKTLRLFNRGTQPYRRLLNQATNIVEKEVEVTTYRTIQGKQVPQRYKVKKRVRQFAGPIKGINPLSSGKGSEEQQRQYNRFAQSIRIEHQLPSLEISLKWQDYASKKQIPVSIEEIKELYAEGSLSRRQVTSILTAWHNIYSNMDDDWYDDMVDQFSEYDDV